MHNSFGPKFFFHRSWAPKIGRRREETTPSGQIRCCCSGYLVRFRFVFPRLTLRVYLFVRPQLDGGKRSARSPWIIRQAVDINERAAAIHSHDWPSPERRKSAASDGCTLVKRQRHTTGRAPLQRGQLLRSCSPRENDHQFQMLIRREGHTSSQTNRQTAIGRLCLSGSGQSNNTFDFHFDSESGPHTFRGVDSPTGTSFLLPVAKSPSANDTTAAAAAQQQQQQQLRPR